MKRGQNYLSPSELELAQSLLDQTRSIDETARLLVEDEDGDHFHKMKDAIIHYVSKWQLVI